MNIFELIEKQNQVAAEIDVLKFDTELEEAEFKKRYAAVKKAVKDLESQISAKASEIADDTSLDYSNVTDAFAQAINNAAEHGTSIEEVILGKDSILDLETVSYMFRIVRSEGKKLVMGGELSAQCKIFPWLVLRITMHGVDGDPIWVDGEAHFDRPHLHAGCGFDLDGSYQRAMLAFFRRAYARQYKGLPQVVNKAVTFADTTRPEIARLDVLRKQPHLPVVFGRGVDCGVVSFDLAQLPHLLVGGGSDHDRGMFLNNLVCGLVSVRSPEELKLIAFDPQLNAFNMYDGLPHLVVPVIRENRRMVFALHWAVCELEKRLEIFARAKVRNINEYNAREERAENSTDDLPETLPYVVIVMGEIAELVTRCKEDVAPEISRLTAKARAAGIHLVLATHCVEPEVVSGTIKANIPGRIALKTATSLASRVILDEAGAECLTGNGDALYRDQYGVLCRVQTPSISEADIKDIVGRYADNDIPPENDGGRADEGVSEEGRRIR